MSIQAGGNGGQSQFLDQISGGDALPSTGQPAGITLPDAEFLLRGDYSRDGDDLRIVKENGEGYTVEGYFSGDAPPALYAPNGAGLLFDTVAKLVGTQVAGYGEPLMVAGPVPGAEPIGTVKNLRGSATAKGTDGQVRELANGDPIYLNDAIETADGSFLRITFEDGTAFFLGRNARAVIDDYVYKPEAEEGSFAASIAVGFFRYISGKLGKLGDGDKPHSSIKTPTATIGIRGSDIEGEVDEQGNTTLVHHSGIIDVADINGLGMVTLLVPGTATVVSPEGVAAIFQAPPEMLQRFQQNLPPPDNGDAPEGEQPPTGEAPPGPPEGEPAAGGEPAPGEGGEGADGEAGEGEGEPEPEPEPEPEEPEDGEPEEGRDQGAEGDEDEWDGPGDGDTPDGLFGGLAADGEGDGAGDRWQPSGADGDDRLELGRREPLVEFDELDALGGDYATGGFDGLIGLDGGGEGGDEFDGPSADELLDGALDGEPEEPEDLLPAVTIDAVDDYYEVQSGHTVYGNMLANDRNYAPDQVEPYIFGYTNPANGVLVVGLDGTFSYTPNAGFQGLDSFIYVVGDGFGGRYPATVNIAVEAFAVVGVDDYFYTDADLPFSGNLLANDIAGLPAGAAPSVVDYTQPTGGTVFIDAAGGFRYTPTAGFSGLDRFTYTATDGLGGRYTAVVEMEVGMPTNVGMAVDDYYFIQEGLVLTGNVVDNDWAVLPAGSSPEIVDYSLPLNGTLTLNADGGFTYTPGAGYVGFDGFSYVLVDGLGGRYAGYVEIDVGGGTAPGEGIDDYYQMRPDTVLSGDLLANDRALLPAGSTITLIGHTQPNNGTVTVGADGTFTYTPYAGFIGIDVFTYEIDDGAGNTLTGFVGIDVGGLYDVTGQLDDYFSTDMNIPVSGNVLSNDYAAAPAGAVLTILSFSQPVHGTVTLSADGSFVYTPFTGFSGFDLFSYTVSDGTTSRTAVVSFDVGIGSPSGNLDDYYYTDSGVPLVANVTDNDWLALPAGATPTVIDYTSPMYGTLTMNADGSFTYVPSAGYAGLDGFNYVIIDGLGGRHEAWVEIEIGGGLNGGDDDYVIEMNMPLTANVLDNDLAYLPAGATPTVVANSAPASGSLSMGRDGSFTYTPFTDFVGHDSFTYTVDDGLGGSHTFYVDIDVGGGGYPTYDDYYYTGVDVPVSANMLDNDRSSLPANAAPLVTAVGQPLYGTLTWSADGRFSYTPSAGFTGHDYFSYTVADGLGGVYNAYVDIDIGVGGAGGAVDDYFNVNVDTAIADNVLNNDWSNFPAGATLSVVNYTQPYGGTLSLNPDGSFVYTPNAGYSGMDGFSYTVNDGAGGTSSAWVSLDVGGGSAMTADDYFYTPMDTPVTGDLFANDWQLVPTGGTLTLVSYSQPAHGTVTIDGSGAFTYTPVAGFLGFDNFTYVVDDGLGGQHTVYVSMDVGGSSGGNAIPVTTYDFYAIAVDTQAFGNVLDNDYDPEGLALSAYLHDLPANGTVNFTVSGAFTYTPNAGFVGNDFFSYTAEDGVGGIQVEWVEIEVGGGGGGNAAPITGYESYTTDVGVSVSGNVLTNDYDPDGAHADLTSWVATFPVNGTVSLDALGNFTYTPDAVYSGPDSFTYGVQDALGAITYQTVDITIGSGGGTNTAPIAGDDYFTTTQGVAVSGYLFTNDYDPDGDPISASLYSGPANGGTVSVSADGNFTYTPPAGLSGGDSFQYQVSDNQGGSVLATVNITITASANSGPVASNDSFSGLHDTPITGNLLTNDSDPDFDTLNVTSYSQPANGSVTVSATGDMNYMPTAAYIGGDSFNYTIDDGFGHTASATVSLTIT